MGMKAGARQHATPIDAVDFCSARLDLTSDQSSTVAVASGRPLEKQSVSRRKGMEKSILDDIMGDPDDFTDFADPDVGSEDDGGRWEDAVRETLAEEEVSIMVGVRGIQDNSQIASKYTKPALMSSTADVGHSDDSSLLNNVEDLGSVGNTGRGLLKVDKKEGIRLLSNVQVDGKSLKLRKVHDTRYYIIKSLNQHNISKSVEKGIWATQAMNEPILNEAFETSERVILIFSINMSGHFQGYAQMTSLIGRRRADVWNEANEFANPWGGTFSVKWLRLYDLPFQQTVHLKNPLNHFKPVKISRDGQELAQDIGEALCSLIDECAEREEKFKRKFGPSTGLGSKRSRGDLHPGSHFDPQLATSIHDGSMSFMLYSGQQGYSETAHKPYNLQKPLNKSLGGLPSRFSGRVEKSGGSGSRSPQRRSELERERDREWHRDQDKATNIAGVEDGIGMHDQSADFSTEEDLLSMTYEQYLQRHGHARGFTDNQRAEGRTAYPTGPPYGGHWTGDHSAVTSQDDEYSAYLANWYSQQGPLVQGDGFYGAHGPCGAYPATLLPDQHWHWHGKSNGSMPMHPF